MAKDGRLEPAKLYWYVPRTVTKYSYVRNNPLNLPYPTGAVFCREAGAGDPEGVTQVCDVTDADYVNSSKDQQAARVFA